jgi:hypothetical protein
MTSDDPDLSVEELMDALYLKLESKNDGLVSVDGNLVYVESWLLKFYLLALTESSRTGKIGNYE